MACQGLPFAPSPEAVRLCGTLRRWSVEDAIMYYNRCKDVTSVSVYTYTFNLCLVTGLNIIIGNSNCAEDSVACSHRPIYKAYLKDMRLYVMD